MQLPSSWTKWVWRAVLAIALICGSTTPAAAGEKFDSGIEIRDNKGQISRSAPAAPNAHTVDVTVGPGFSFHPDFVTIVTGDTIRWTWVTSNHTVSSGDPTCALDNRYCSPTNAANCSTAIVSNAGTVYSHTFAQPGTYTYLCRVHCGGGMIGSVSVVAPFVTPSDLARTTDGHFIFRGRTVANATVTIQTAPDLSSEFTTIGTTIADATGAFEYDDGSDPSRLSRFYRAILP